MHHCCSFLNGICGSHCEPASGQHSTLASFSEARHAIIQAMHPDHVARFLNGLHALTHAINGGPVSSCSILGACPWLNTTKPQGLYIYERRRVIYHLTYLDAITVPTNQEGSTDEALP